MAKQTRYRLVVHVSGATRQNFYAAGEKQLASKRAAAIKALSSWEPGRAGLTPQHIDVQRQLKAAGRYTTWETLETIKYSDVPDDHLDWKVRQRNMEEAQRDVREAEARLVKNPIGLMPRWRWRELRMLEIQAAIDRYEAAEKEIPQEWRDELNDHIAATPMRHICESCSQPLVLCPHFNEKSQRHQAWAGEVSDVRPLEGSDA